MFNVVIILLDYLILHSWKSNNTGPWPQESLCTVIFSCEGSQPRGYRSSILPLSGVHCIGCMLGFNSPYSGRCWEWFGLWVVAETYPLCPVIVQVLKNGVRMCVNMWMWIYVLREIVGTVVTVALITRRATLNHVMTFRSLTLGCMQTVTCSTCLRIHWHENRFRCWTAWLLFLQHPGTHRRQPVTKYLRRGFCEPGSYTDTYAGVLFCFMAWLRRRHSPLVVQVMSKIFLEMSAT